MDLSKIIAELRAERDRLDQAILALERLVRKNQPRRGRPPDWLKREAEQASEDPEGAANHPPRQRGAAAG